MPTNNYALIWQTAPFQYARAVYAYGTFGYNIDQILYASVNQALRSTHATHNIIIDRQPKHDAPGQYERDAAELNSRVDNIANNHVDLATHELNGLQENKSRLEYDLALLNNDAAVAVGSEVTSLNRQIKAKGESLKKVQNKIDAIEHQFKDSALQVGGDNGDE